MEPVTLSSEFRFTIHRDSGAAKILLIKLSTFFDFIVSKGVFTQNSSRSTNILNILVSSNTFLNLITVLPPTFISYGPCGLGTVALPVMLNLQKKKVYFGTFFIGRVISSLFVISSTNFLQLLQIYLPVNIKVTNSESVTTLSKLF